MQFDSAFQALIELAASRHNAFSTSEAADINFSSRRLRDAAARGDIRRLHPRVWAINALPNSELQRLRAATLSLSGSAASLLSAAWLHGWVERPPDRPQVWAGPKSTARLSGAHVHRFVRIDPGLDVTEIDHVPVLNKAATLCLMGAACTPLVLERCLDEFLRTESKRWLDDTMARLYTPYARGPYALWQVLEDPVRVPGIAESVMERITAQLLAHPGLPPIVLQHELEVDGQRFRLDIACPELLLGVEYHSRTYHWGREKADADNVRDLLIGSLGWKVIYVTNAQVKHPEQLICFYRRTAEAQAKQLGVDLPALAPTPAAARAADG